MEQDGLIGVLVTTPALVVKLTQCHHGLQPHLIVECPVVQPLRTMGIGGALGEVDNLSDEMVSVKLA